MGRGQRKRLRMIEPITPNNTEQIKVLELVHTQVLENVCERHWVGGSDNREVTYQTEVAKVTGREMG